MLEREELRAREQTEEQLRIPTGPNPINLGNAFCEKFTTVTGEGVHPQGRDGSGCSVMRPDPLLVPSQFAKRKIQLDRGS